MRALNNYIVVKHIVKQVEESKSGLLLSGQDSAKQRYQNAIIVEPGEFAEVLPVGTEVVYDAVQGHDYRHDEEIYRVIQYRDVALIV